MGKHISFQNGDALVQAYLAPSATGTGPGIIVLQEWWGLVGHIRSVVDRFAEAGFTALAPDLYGGKTASEPDDAATLMQALNIAETEKILGKAIETLIGQPETKPNSKVGVVGFCMGGQLALFAATTNEAIGAAVDFYGIHPNVHPEFERLNAPLLGFFAEHDAYASPTAVAALDAQLTSANKQHIFKTYPGTHHAFFNDDRPEVYDRDASADAWKSTLDFFRSSLS